MFLRIGWWLLLCDLVTSEASELLLEREVEHHAAGLGTAAESLAPGLEILLAGRILYGLGIGFAMHAAPAYIAETAPASKRGLLIRSVPLQGIFELLHSMDVQQRGANVLEMTGELLLDEHQLSLLTLE